MVSFAQFLQNAGIHLQPAVFIAIVAGAIVFIVALIVTIVYVHGRNKRKYEEGAFDKPAISVLSLAQPRPPLPSSSYDREAQKQELVGREVRQQEDTYAQLMRDLQRPSSRAASPSLPNQSPREFGPRMAQRQQFQGSPLAVPAVTSPPPTFAAPPPPPPAVFEDMLSSAAQLKRGVSIRSLDSESIYSSASAPRDAPQERTYQPFNVMPTIPASPTTPLTPKWPSSPAPYNWPKRQRASLIREELAPETYAKVQWRTDEASVDPTRTIPVAQAMPSTPTAPRAPLGLRINVPPAQSHYSPPSQAYHPMPADSPESATTAAVYYSAHAMVSPAPTPRTPRQRQPF